MKKGPRVSSVSAKTIDNVVKLVNYINENKKLPNFTDPIYRVIYRMKDKNRVDDIVTNVLDTISDLGFNGKNFHLGQTAMFVELKKLRDSGNLPTKKDDLALWALNNECTNMYSQMHVQRKSLARKYLGILS